jgi:hypothetical protein
MVGAFCRTLLSIIPIGILTIAPLVYYSYRNTSIAALSIFPIDNRQTPSNKINPGPRIIARAYARTSVSVDPRPGNAYRAPMRVQMPARMLILPSSLLFL